MAAVNPIGRSLHEAVARILRHEVGDLLQSIYATVAILQKRLPAEWSVERRILSDVRHRAETCRQLLDAVHDYACPMTLSPGTVDLAELAEGLVRAAQERHPQLHVGLEASPTAPLTGDERRLSQLGSALLGNACEAARTRVLVRLGLAADGTEIEWTFTDDGPGVSSELQPRLFQPFVTTRHARAGLGLALSEKIAQLHGGRIGFENRPANGAQFRVLLPLHVPETQKNAAD